MGSLARVTLMSAAPCDIAVDCGSGGTRVWHLSQERGLERLPWHSGGRAPVLSQVLPSETARSEFAQGLQHFVAPGTRMFIGATAGLRYAIERGDVTPSDLEAFCQLLPKGCEFTILEPVQEAHYELRALQAKCDIEAFSMLSMGGKSMQLGREGALFSLPFAMHLGYEKLNSLGASWHATIHSLAELYEALCAEEKKKQGMPLVDGLVVGVTDTLDVASSLDLLGNKVPVAAFVETLDTCVSKYAACAQGSLEKKDFILLARSLAMRAVAKHLFAPTSELLFREEWQVNWTSGYFLDTR